MTHYRDSKTRAGRIVLVLGKCSAQMRRANESERYGNGGERGRREASWDNFFSLRSSDRCTQYAPCRAV